MSILEKFQVMKVQIFLIKKANASTKKKLKILNLNQPLNSKALFVKQNKNHHLLKIVTMND